jgi:hypothetical protein
MLVWLKVGSEVIRKGRKEEEEVVLLLGRTMFC